MDSDDSLAKILHGANGVLALNAVKTGTIDANALQQTLENFGIFSMTDFQGDSSPWDAKIIIEVLCSDYLDTDQTDDQRKELDATITNVILLDHLATCLTQATSTRYTNARKLFNENTLPFVPPEACLDIDHMNALNQAILDKHSKVGKDNWATFFEKFIKYPQPRSTEQKLQKIADTLLAPTPTPPTNVTGSPSTSTTSTTFFMPRKQRTLTEILQDANVAPEQGDEELKKIADKFDADMFATLKTKEDRQNALTLFITSALTEVAVKCPKRFRLIFYLTNPSEYGNTFPPISHNPFTVNAPTWNGERQRFVPWVEGFLAQLGQRDMSYIQDKDFKKVYRKYPAQKIYAIVTDAGARAHLTKERLQTDSAFVCSALQQCVHSSLIKATISAPMDKQDGILALYELEDHYRYGRNTIHVENTLEDQINAEFDPKKDNLKKWVDQKVYALTEMDKVNPNAFPTDAAKIKKLCDKAGHPSIVFPVSIARHKATFGDCVDHLLEFAESVQHANLKQGRTHIRHVGTTGYDDDDIPYEFSNDDAYSQLSDTTNNEAIVQFIQHLPDDETAMHFIHNLRSNNNPNGPFLRDMPPWAKTDKRFIELLSDEAKDLVYRDRIAHFIKHPDELLRRDGGARKTDSSTDSGYSSFTPTPSAKLDVKGRQYDKRPYAAKDRKANLTQDAQDEDDDADENRTADVIAELQADIKTLLTKAQDANILCVHANVQHYRILALASSDNRWYIVALDNGADTSVLGKGWWVQSYVMGPNGDKKYANLVGFDPIVRKCRLPMVSALGLLEIGPYKFLLRVNQAVYNEEVDLTLLSEFQVKNNNWIVDTTAKHHRSYNTCGHGLQQMEYEDEEGHSTIIPFRLRNCLMTFTIREPTAQERESMTPIDITSDSPWQPQDQTDQDDIFAYRLAQYTHNPSEQYHAPDPLPETDDSDSLN